MIGLENRLAKFISFLFHPLIMPLYAFCIILFTDNYISNFIPLSLKYVICGITFFFTFFLPTANALVLLKLNHIKSLEMETSEERLIPYSSGILYYSILLYLFHKANFLTIFQLFILGNVFCILFTLIINIKWKISAHAIGIGGLIGTLMVLISKFYIHLEFFFLIAILLAGCIGYARLKLEAHTPLQIYMGLALGFVIQYTTLTFPF